MRAENTVRVDDADSERRRSSRHAVLLQIPAIVAGEERQLTVRDLSVTGFLAEGAPALELGDTVELDLPDLGRRHARVAWTGSTLAGCTFNQVIPRGVLSAARLKSGQSQFEVPAPVAASPEDSVAIEPLDPRTRLLIIAGLGATCWLPVLAVAALFFS